MPLPPKLKFLRPRAATLALGADGTTHRGGDVLLAAFAELLCGVEAISFLPVLAQLPFADHAGDLHLDSNDRGKHLVDIFLGRVRHLPRPWRAGLGFVRT